jgi:hypothetical protein
MIDSRKVLKLLEELPSNVRLVAVSKFKSVETIMEAYNLGIRDFGENRPQELRMKIPLLPDDIRWHFIGHLQRNKVRMVMENVALIHSVDSFRLAEEIDKEAKKLSLVKDCLLQAEIADEETKQGIPYEILEEEAQRIGRLANIRICGLMGMATNTDDMVKVEGEFSLLKLKFEELKNTLFKENEHFRELSMGMSSDWRVAVESGSTIVRIGSLIFGARQ